MNFPIRRLAAAGTALAATIAIFAIPASASAATPERCFVVADPKAIQNVDDWLCDGTSTPTYVVVGTSTAGSGFVYRGADWRAMVGGSTDVKPIAKQQSTIDSNGNVDGLAQFWTSTDGFGTRTWAQQEPGVWVGGVLQAS